jgi:hypothetical protein
MSYSSITSRKQLKELEEIQEYEETQEYKEQQIIDEYNKQQETKNRKNKNKYKYKNNEETYNRNSTNTNNKNGDDNQQNISQYNPDFCVEPRFINIYNKKYCIKWLAIHLDNNYYHYDYCLKLFEMLMKWVRYNNFALKTGENPLLGKFISLMYLLSNKKGYGYSLM